MEESVTPYAFDEFFQIAGARLVEQDGLNTDALRYLSALVSELTYYHVPQWEIDLKKRIKIPFPSLAYAKILNSRKAQSVTELFPEGDEFARRVVMESQGVIAVSHMTRDVLFIGFRGTKFLFDWKANLDCGLMPIGSSRYRLDNSRVHRGFMKEVLEAAVRIRSQLQDIYQNQSKTPKYVVFCGHSLGGAIAALSYNFATLPFPHERRFVVFGTPRYSDLKFHFRTLEGDTQTQIRRTGDIVPEIIPRKLGFADYPIQFNTDGNEFSSLQLNNNFSGSLRNILGFTKARAEPHAIETYRKELGEHCNMNGSQNDFSKYFEKIAKKDLDDKSR